MTQHRRAHASERPRSSAIRRILATAGVFGVAIATALSATGATYALWSDNASVNAPTLTAGSTGLTINGMTDATIPMTAAHLYPGGSVVSAAPLTVHNTGTVPLSVTAAAPVFSSTDAVLAPHLTVALRPSDACAPGAVGTPPTALPASMGSPLLLPPGADVRLCLEVYLSADAPSTVQGAAAAFAVELDGAQVPRS
ncbi:SipW-dependent-type signal peptide-containing protein [Mycetocola miduiensis]|uniref:SipW-cognate class signal peptide n=1 Tax=Mycetocola miduiensis TaxID=995034 RepID=A0A1I5B3S7_9MICO|nr:SipW-dependent-type signal peptide-containing protein [Mycetocola miduiensis]SFN69271.1 SipW-cognate class signal peptide [Mycetocola miduiensis]